VKIADLGYEALDPEVPRYLTAEGGETQDFGYNDGDEAERWVGSVIEHARDRSTGSLELKHGIRDWSSFYHLTRKRGNIVKPVIETFGHSVLEVGSGMGAISRALGEAGLDVVSLEGSPRRSHIGAMRCADLENVTVVNDVIQNFSGAQFDTVLVVGVLEYSRMFLEVPHGVDAVTEMLDHLVSLVAPGGQLVVAIENQLGLKYLVGVPEDHVGQRMVGVEGTYPERGPVTFGRRELRARLAQAGLANQDWYYPFPDYKVPACVIAEAAWDGASGFDPVPLVAPTFGGDPQRPATVLFDAGLAEDVVARNGLGRDLANSFLVRASACKLDAPPTLAWQFGSGDRLARFSTVTTFEPAAGQHSGPGEDAGAIEVHRTVPSAAGQGAQAAWTVLDPTPVEPYFPGRTWQDRLWAIMSRPGWTADAVDTWFNTWYRCVLEEVGVDQASASAETPLPAWMVDAIPQNLIVAADGRHRFIDREWAAAGEFTLGWLVFRAFLAQARGFPPVAEPSDHELLEFRTLMPRLGAWQAMGLTDGDVAELWAKECAFQSAVYSDGAPADPNTEPGGEARDGEQVMAGGGSRTVWGRLTERVTCDEVIRHHEGWAKLRQRTRAAEVEAKLARDSEAEARAAATGLAAQNERLRQAAA
jgi:2-polyprenyl-3-methyl-5-hydroxy-6-metoxy-1,4-benzoquinol methylase